MLNTALLGAGRIAGVHATAISTNPGSRLVAVSDINIEAAGNLAAQYGAEARTTDAILADPEAERAVLRSCVENIVQRDTMSTESLLGEIRAHLGRA